MVVLPSVTRRALEPLRVTRPLNLTRPARRKRESVAERLRFPLTVTLLSRPSSEVTSSAAPSARLIVPPVIVPPAKFHEPLLALRCNVPPPRFIPPVTFTVPPERLSVPRFARL